MCVLRLIQVVRSVEKIEKILHSQNSKESSSLEISRWETDMLTNPLASLNSLNLSLNVVIYQVVAVSILLYYNAFWYSAYPDMTNRMSINRQIKLAGKGPVFLCLTSCLFVCLSACLPACLSVQSLVSRSDPGENCYRIQPAAVPRCTEQRHAPTGQSQTCKC